MCAIQYTQLPSSSAVIYGDDILACFLCAFRCCLRFFPACQLSSVLWRISAGLLKQTANPSECNVNMKMSMWLMFNEIVFRKCHLRNKFYTKRSRDERLTASQLHKKNSDSVSSVCSFAEWEVENNSIRWTCIDYMSCNMMHSYTFAVWPWPTLWPCASALFSTTDVMRGGGTVYHIFW